VPEGVVISKEIKSDSWEKKIQTLSALLLNLFILENCFSLDFTMSPRGTFGAFLAF
jgi:hypothetical protein